MPTPTYTPLANVTLASTTSTVTFSSIPATYRDLLVVAQCGVVGPATENLQLSLNNDTTNANYAAVQMSGDGSTVYGVSLGSETRFINCLLYTSPSPRDS